MHTAHLLTVSQHALHRGNVCPGGLPGGLHRGVSTQGVSAWGVCWGGWVCLPRGSAWGCLPRGFCPGGVCPGRCLSGGFCPGGLPGRLSAWGFLPGGVAWEVVCPGGLPRGAGVFVQGVCIPVCNRPNTHPVDRQTPLKTLYYTFCKKRLRGNQMNRTSAQKKVWSVFSTWLYRAEMTSGHTQKGIPSVEMEEVDRRALGFLAWKCILLWYD